MNRRNFLFGAAGLMAVAVAPNLKALAPTERERLAAMLATGLVEGQTFLLPDPGPIVLRGLHNVSITGCNFIWQVPVGDFMIDAEGCDNLVIKYCHFNGGHKVSHPGYYKPIRYGSDPLANVGKYHILGLG